MARAVAWFETERIDEAARDLFPVSSSAAIYPFSVSVIYAQCLEIRIQALRGLVMEAKQQLQKLWQILGKANRLNPDFLLALARTELFLCRVFGDVSRPWATAGLLIARSLGQEVYVGLAGLELACSAPEAAKPNAFFLKQFVFPYLGQQPVLKKHFDEIKEISLRDFHKSGRMTLVVVDGSNF